MYDMRKLTGIVIDAGHGGSDPGAVSGTNLEKDYTLLISKYIYDRLKEMGIPVYITRDKDITLNPTDRVNEVLKAFGNNKDVVVISNHLNAGGGEGAEVIYALRNNSILANNILNNIGDVGQKTRKTYQRRLPTDSSKDYYYMLRNTGVTEPVIVEYGFIDNDKDRKFIEDNYKELGEAVIKAVLEYKGLPYVPKKELVTNTYTVKKGDTLYSIAKDLNTTVDELKKLNNLSTNLLTVGQVLNIPSTVMSIEEGSVYKVKSGDTLYKIALEYNTTVDELKKLNGLTSNVLTIGQLLKVPGSSLQTKEYIVKKGDTLYSIASGLNTTVDELKKANNLTSNMISIGQKLIVPNELETIYTVKPGDNLYQIARKFNTTVDKLITLNNLKNTTLSVGQILIVRDVS